jgi:hydroxymethylbilane synthase
MSADPMLVRVGTRESVLARLQTDIVVAAMRDKFPKQQFAIVPITTHGDKVQDKPIADLGTRGVFVKELERALIAGEVDFVVHSLKDLPSDLPEGLHLAALLNREDPRDVLISHGAVPLKNLLPGALVATSSRRRTAQLLAARPDLKFADMRGNIQTRFRKFDERQCDAMVLAAAGLIRLGMEDRITEFLPIEISTPAVGQGALAVECLSTDTRMIELLAAIDDKNVRCQSTAERTFLERLGGGCSVPIGGIARSSPQGGLTMTGCVAALDGSKVLRATAHGTTERAAELGNKLADELFAMGAEQILSALRQSQPNMISAP